MQYFHFLILWKWFVHIFCSLLTYGTLQWTKVIKLFDLHLLNDLKMPRIHCNRMPLLCQCEVSASKWRPQSIVSTLSSNSRERMDHGWHFCLKLNGSLHWQRAENLGVIQTEQKIPGNEIQMKTFEQFKWMWRLKMNDECSIVVERVSNSTVLRKNYKS